jgi:hypothetical protein
VGVERQGVEKEIGQPMARKVLGGRHAFREDEPRRIDATRRGFTPQVPLGDGVVTQQPQHAAVDLPEQSHPALEHRGGDLVVVVEAAEHEAIVGQPGGASIQRDRRDDAPRVGDEIAVRQLRDFLGEVCCFAQWRNHRVADHIIDERRPHRSGMAEPADLQRRRPVRQDAKPGIAAVAGQIDRDVDIKIADELRGLPIAHALQIVKLIERGDEPPAQLAAVVGI